LFYFTIRNLPAFHNRNQINIHLAAIALSDDLARHGHDAVLKRFAVDLKQLEMGGIRLETGTVVWGTLGLFTGDTLGRSAILNMVESSQANRFCDICLASLYEIQSKFRESDFQLRTQQGYENQMDMFAACKKKKDVDQFITTFGVKGECSLNLLDHFHITNNFGVDLMHDWDEVSRLLKVPNAIKIYVKNESFFLYFWNRDPYSITFLYWHKIEKWREI